MDNVYPKTLKLNNLSIESTTPVIPIPTTDSVTQVQGIASFKTNGGAIIKKGVQLGESNDIYGTPGLITYSETNEALRVYHSRTKSGLVVDSQTKLKYDNIDIVTTNDDDVTTELDVGLYENFYITTDPTDTTRYYFEFNVSNTSDTETWNKITIIIYNQSSTSEKTRIFFTSDNLYINSDISTTTDSETGESYVQLSGEKRAKLTLTLIDQTDLYFDQIIRYS